VKDQGIVAIVLHVTFSATHSKVDMLCNKIPVALGVFGHRVTVQALTVLHPIKRAEMALLAIVLDHSVSV
jgi:hypothetical protein